ALLWTMQSGTWGTGSVAARHRACNTTAGTGSPRRTAGPRPPALRRFVHAPCRGGRTAADAAATSGRRLVPWRARAGVEHSAAGWPLGGGAGAAAPAAAGVAAIPVPRHGRLGGRPLRFPGGARAHAAPRAPAAGGGDARRRRPPRARQWEGP